ncbi:hypothetical protein BDR22DRAFT_884375 [Usnea florida]
MINLYRSLILCHDGFAWDHLGETMSFLEELYAGTGIWQSQGTGEPILDHTRPESKGQRDTCYRNPDARIFLYDYDSSLLIAFSDPRGRNIPEATSGVIVFGTPYGGPGNNWVSASFATFKPYALSVAAQLPRVH